MVFDNNGRKIFRSYSYFDFSRYYGTHPGVSLEHFYRNNSFYVFSLTNVLVIRRETLVNQYVSCFHTLNVASLALVHEL